MMQRPLVPDEPARQRERASEARLLEIRREAERKGMVEGAGVRPAGAPFPMASPEAGYYGIPLLKEPQWKWEVPLYFFVGGAAGASAVIAAVANLRGADHDLVKKARLLAAGGGIVSAALLTADLGRPARFAYMLRVFKPQSPMSVGAWTLAAFSSTSAAGAFAALLDDAIGGFGPVRAVGNLAEFLAGALGTVMSSYTGVLIGATAVPVWNRNVKTLPIHFAASGLNSAVSLLELMNHEESRALNALGIAASLFEVAEGLVVEGKLGEENAPLHEGVSGWVNRAGGMLSGPIPLIMRLIGGSRGSEMSRNMRKAAAVSSLVGSLITRFAWMRAGKASAKDYRLPLEIEK